MKVINYFRENKSIFAKGICFDKLFVIFVISSIIGSLYEQLLTLVRTFINTHEIVWASRTAVIYGQFNMVYGFGAVIMVLLLCRKKLSNLKIVLYGSLIGGGFEYIINFLQEKFLGNVSWNYSNNFLNINGRTTIPFMLVWGLLCLFVVKVLYPFISKLIEKIPYNLGKLINFILVIFLSIDIIISWGALIRQTLRNYDIKAYTFVGRFFDKFYPDEVLIKAYPNMVVKKND